MLHRLFSALEAYEILLLLYTTLRALDGNSEDGKFHREGQWNEWCTFACVCKWLARHACMLLNVPSRVSEPCRANTIVALYVASPATGVGSCHTTLPCFQLALAGTHPGRTIKFCADLVYSWSTPGLLRFRSASDYECIYLRAWYITSVCMYGGMQHETGKS